MSDHSDNAVSMGTDATDVDEQTNAMAIRALVPLLVTFILGALCLQGFNLVFTQVGEAVRAPGQASLITALPSIVLGIVCFIYGSLGDFVSLKKLVAFGLVTLLIGSLFGFISNYYFSANLWTVIIARVLQTAGEQVAGSAYLVVATKYLKNSLKVIFFGLFTAGYPLSAAIGVFAAGMLSSISWQFLFLIPAVTIVFLPLLLKNLPDGNHSGQRVDGFGFAIFGVATAFLTLFFSYLSWWMLLIAAVLFLGFAYYIGSADHPFITPAFFRNTRWLCAISLILVFYFVNYCISPVFNAIAHNLYGMQTSTVSNYLVWAFVVAAVVSSVLDTLPKDESGRGVGMNDLVMNVAGSIGIAIIGSLIGSPALGGASLFGVSGNASSYANLLLICGAVVLLGLVVFLVFRRHIYAANR